MAGEGGGTDDFRLHYVVGGQTGPPSRALGYPVTQQTDPLANNENDASEDEYESTDGDVTVAENRDGNGVKAQILELKRLFEVKVAELVTELEKKKESEILATRMIGSLEEERILLKAKPETKNQNLWIF